MAETIREHLPYIVALNFALVAALVLLLGRAAAATPLTERPGVRQNAAEAVMDWFVDLARRVHPQQVSLIAPFLATLFLLILGSNLLAVLPLPILRIPPMAYFSAPLALALVAVIGATVLSAKIKGVRATAKHTIWPNPLHLVGEASHALSLSLRLYGNIGGEFIVATLATQAVPYLFPAIIHAFGLIPAVVQPIVFVLLTVNVLATAVQPDQTPSRSPQ